MSDHNLPVVATPYAAFLTALSGRIQDSMMMNDPAFASVTNPPTNAIRWNSASSKFEKYNGSNWVTLSSSFAINISGSAASAAVASAVAWAGISGKPTTIAGYAISDAAPLASPNFTGTVTLNTFEAGFRGIPSIANSGGGANGAQGRIYKDTGSHTVPANVFSADDVYGIYANTASPISILQGAGLTMRLVGTSLTGNRVLASRGLATVFFVSATECVITGGGIS